MKSRFWMGVCLCSVFALFVAGMSIPATAGSTGKLVIFHAGSLTVPLTQMETEFRAKNPEVVIQREAGGSTKLARMILEHQKPADIMISADDEVIDKMLIPREASWNIRFASNELVLCYTGKSKCADRITVDNWYYILGTNGVAWGHSDPNVDPCGYRALMALQLAEIYYKKPGLYKLLLDNRPKENIRAKAVELVSLLQTGNMDYAWEYLSVAIQHKLKYVKLPNEINLGDYRLDDFYRQAKVEVEGQKPGAKITQIGRSCTYGLTIVKSAPNPDLAVMFLKYMLSPEGGLKILKDCGQPPFIAGWVPTDEMKRKLPADLGSIVNVQKATEK